MFSGSNSVVCVINNQVGTELQWRFATDYFTRN